MIGRILYIPRKNGWRPWIRQGSLTYFRKWVIQKYHKKFYKRGEITEKGREIKSLSEEMVNSMKVFPERRTDSSFMVTKKNKRFAEVVDATWKDLGDLQEGWDTNTDFVLSTGER
jgi:hypothetical protein